MTPLVLGALLGIGASLGVYLWLAHTDSRSASNLRQYFFYDWSLDSTTIAATIFASGMSLATVLIAMMQLGVYFGIALMWAVATYCLGWVCLIGVAGKIRSHLADTETIHGFLGRRYGSSTLRSVASVATIVGFVGTFSTELLAGSILLDALGFSPRVATVGIIVFGVVALFYSSFGGFRAVIRSDRIQASLLVPTLFAFAGLAILYWKNLDGPALADSPLLRTYTLPVWVAVNLALINVPFPLVDMSAWQRVSAASSDSSFTNGGWAAVAGFFVAWTTVLMIAILVGPIIPEGENPFVAVLQGVSQLDGALTFILAAIVFPGLVAAMLSTADTFLNAAGHTFSLDLLGVDARAEARGQRPHVRLHVLGLGVVGFALALVLRGIGFGIVELVFAVYGSALALFAPVALALTIPGRYDLRPLRASAMAAIVAGVVSCWANGVYSVLATSGALELPASVANIVPPDVYRSPTYGIAISTAVFLLTGSPAVRAIARRAQV